MSRTNGKWKVMVRPTPVGDCFEVYNNKGKFVATVPSEEDADFIAAAPEVFDILQEIFDSGLLHDLTTGKDDLRRKAREVLHTKGEIA